MKPLYKSVAQSGAVIGFCGGIPAAALILLCLSMMEPDPPPTLLFYTVFVVCFSAFTLITGLVTAVCTCWLVLRARKSQLWQRLMIGDAGIIFVRWLEKRGQNRQTLMGGLIGARTGCVVGAVLTVVTLTLLAFFTGDIGAPMLWAIIEVVAYIMAVVCALHGIPIGAMVVKNLDRFLPAE